MWKENKFDTAIGYFWGASVFIGVLVGVILGFGDTNWLEASLIGLCTFLITGLVISGIITLVKTNK